MFLAPVVCQVRFALATGFMRSTHIKEFTLFTFRIKEYPVVRRVEESCQVVLPPEFPRNPMPEFSSLIENGGSIGQKLRNIVEQKCPIVFQDSNRGVDPFLWSIFMYWSNGRLSL